MRALSALSSFLTFAPPPSFALIEAAAMSTRPAAMASSLRRLPSPFASSIPLRRLPLRRCRPQTFAAAPHTRRYNSTSSASSSSPSSSSSNFPAPYYCTIPIFYVNAAPHIGHLHSGVLADVLTRWHQLRYNGYASSSHQELARSQSKDKTRAILATGTDEHGLKIQRAAQAAGKDPQHFCDEVSQHFRRLADAAGLDYHTFIRTTEPRHAEAVKAVWRALDEAGHIYKGKHEGWYAVSDEAFYPQGQVRKCRNEKTGEEWCEAVETGQRVEWTSEENYKFRMSSFRQSLIDWLEANPTAILPPTRHAEVLEEIRSGLEDLSISRPTSRLQWGLRVPGDDSQTIYVWVDALVNYLTVTGYPWQEGDSASNSLRAAWPASTHVVGKDILRFHAIYWPSLLLASSLPLPRQIVAHSHWTMEGRKMSKSRGNVVDPFKEMQEKGVDVVRAYLCRMGGGLASDSDWSEATLLEFERKYLQGQLGNLASRIRGKKILKRLQPAADDAAVAYVSRPSSSSPSHSPHLASLLLTTPTGYSTRLERCEVGQAFEVVLSLLAACNAFVQATEPWQASTSQESVEAAVYYTYETLRLTAGLLGPVMPGKMGELRESLGLEGAQEEDGGAWEEFVKVRERVRVPLGVGKVKPLFPRREGVEQ